MADKSIGELKPTHIEDLPSAAHVYDEMLFAGRYQGDTVKVSGEQLTAYLAPTVNADVEAAKTAAEAAEKSAQSAADVALYPPKVQGGNWWVWDLATRTYKDSGIDASVSLSIGTVKTGAPGTPVTVTNRGTATDPILDITIPQGAKGDTGNKGDTGSKGDKGDAATVTIGTVTTGAPGAAAKVTNRGTPNAAILDITIPKGDKGDTGPVSSVNGETGAVTVEKLIGPSASVAVRRDVGYSGMDYYNNAGKFIGAIRVDPNPIGAEGGYHPIELVNEANSNGCRIYTQADPPPKEPPAVYTVYGPIINCTDLSVTAVGAATVTVYRSGFVRVEFTAKTTHNTLTKSFAWGLNTNMLRSLNGAIPAITPHSGGRGLISDKSGALDMDKIGYGMDFCANGEFWTPQRVYTPEGGNGIWGTDALPVDHLITGTVYGMVAGAAAIQDEEAQADMGVTPQRDAQTKNTQENITQEEENEREHI